MAKQIIVLAFIFFAAVGLASAQTAAPSLAPAASTGESYDDTIGTISGGRTASDAAPLGSPVPDGVFPDLTTAPAPAESGAAACMGPVVARATAVAAVVVGSFFF